jgi:hypothetical protein
MPSFVLSQFDSEPALEYEDFDECVDEFFSQAEKQRNKEKVEAKGNSIFNKVTRIQEDQQKRIDGLKKEQDMSEFKAQLLQKYSFEAQAIIDILSVMLNSGISWRDIKRMIKEERKSGNPLANLIHTVDLEKQNAALLLDAVDEDEDHILQVEDRYIDNFDPVVKVDIDL